MSERETLTESLPRITDPDHECLFYGKHIWWSVGWDKVLVVQKCNCGAVRKLAVKG